MRVLVRLFAGHKEKAGTSSFYVELTKSATVGDLASEVVKRFPSLTKEAPSLVIAIDDEFREHDFKLNYCTEAAIIPPVSGGSSVMNMPLQIIFRNPGQ